jgi:hypothetical protein
LNFKKIKEEKLQKIGLRIFFENFKKARQKRLLFLKKYCNINKQFNECRDV